MDERVSVLALEGETVREDPNGMVWTEVEYGKEGWKQGSQCKLAYDEATARAELGVSVRQKAAMSGAEGRASDDKMTRRELAGWHIIRNATGATPRAAELRKALAAVAQGATDSNALNVAWRDEFDAKASVRASAHAQLSRIGRLVEMLMPPKSPDPREPTNFDPDQQRFRHMQEKTIEGFIVNTRDLQLCDRKAFALALYEPKGVGAKGDKFSGLQPHHFLDCTPNHNPDGTSNILPAEDAHAFITRYREAKKGRYVLFGLQHLAGDVQGVVRTVAEEGATDGKELIVVISGGDIGDEKIESVNQTACDVRWRKWAHSRVKDLRKFREITYYDQAWSREDLRDQQGH